MPERAYLDTNVIIRLLVNDNPEHAGASAKLLEDSARIGRRLIISPVTFAEIVFVLSGSTYRLPHARLVAAIDQILQLPLVFEDQEVVELALELFRERHKNWADCVVAASAIIRADGHIATFDQRLRRLPGLEPLPLS